MSKTSVDEVFMHHFEKMSPASAAPLPCWGTQLQLPPDLAGDSFSSAPEPCWGTASAAPGPCWGTASALPLNPAGGHSFSCPWRAWTLLGDSFS